MSDPEHLLSIWDQQKHISILNQMRLKELGGKLENRGGVGGESHKNQLNLYIF